MEISKSLASPGWWIRVFFAEILVNIISAYLKPLLDRYGLRFRRFVGMRVETGRAMHTANVS